MNIIKKISQFNQVINNNVSLVRNTEDIYCLELISNLLRQGEFLPFTFMSLRPFALSFIVNEIIVNKRSQLIEFGSGASTVVIARAIRNCGLDCKIISIESDESWFKSIGKILQKESLTDIVKLIHAPLTLREMDGSSLLWYDELTIREEIRLCPSADVVLIDGPSAFDKNFGLNRYFAMPFLQNMLTEHHCIFLDDANRGGEVKVLDLWKKAFGKEFTIYANTLAVHYTGSHFDCCPLKFVDKK